MKTKLLTLLLCLSSLSVMGQGIITRNKPKQEQAAKKKEGPKKETPAKKQQPAAQKSKLVTKEEQTCTNCGKLISQCQYKGKHPQKRQITEVKTNLHSPSLPTDLTVRDRTIYDLLYFPYGILPRSVKTKKELATTLDKTLGSHNIINGGIGEYFSEPYNYVYRGKNIGIAYISTDEDVDFWCFYHFFFDTKKEADAFYLQVCNDLIGAGIPLTKDNIYGGMSNRKNPISIFKWVAVTPGKLIKELDSHYYIKDEFLGKYDVEFSVYKYYKKL